VVVLACSTITCTFISSPSSTYTYTRSRSGGLWIMSSSTINLQLSYRRDSIDSFFYVDN